MDAEADEANEANAGVLPSPEDTLEPTPLQDTLKTSEDHDKQEIVAQANELLQLLGFGERAFGRFDDLLASVSSMSVALYEKLFAFRLENILRVPNKPKDYVHNAQVVVDALAGALLDKQFDQEITGQQLCEGQLQALAQLLRMFRHVYDLLHAAQTLEEAKCQQPTQLVQSPTEPQPSTTRQRVKKKKTIKKLIKTRPKKNSIQETPSKDNSRVAPMPTQASTKARSNAQARRMDKSAAHERAFKKRSRRRENQKQKHRSDSERAEEQEEEVKRKQLTIVKDESLQKDLKDYIPVKTSRINRSDGSHDVSPPASDSPPVSQEKQAEEEAGNDAMFFGGVSSVSLATSEQNGHDFSQLSLNDKLSDEGEAREDRQEEDSENLNHAVLNAAERAKTNQYESWMEHRAKKQHAVETAKPQRAVLYPLTPARMESMGHKENLRYRIALKDHLQELRQREMCHRKRLERAFHLGEHAANVEKIRARRLQQDLRLQRISLGMQQKSLEEKELRDTMNHLLHLEKERLREEHRHTSHVLKTIQREHHERENAMATFYSNQIDLVKEQTQREMKEREMIEKARKMASFQLLREMRRDREDQLQLLVEQKKHMAEVQRFRHGNKLASAVLSTPSVLDLAATRKVARSVVASTATKPRTKVAGKPPNSSSKAKRAMSTRPAVASPASLSRARIHETMRIYGVPKQQRQALVP